MGGVRRVRGVRRGVRRGVMSWLPILLLVVNFLTTTFLGASGPHRSDGKYNQHFSFRNNSVRE